MNNEYDITRAFRRIEETLIKSMKRNLTRHLNEEKDLDMNWSAWQAEQLKSLEQFKKNNKHLFKNDFFTINNEVEAFIKKAYEDGRLKQEKAILEAIKNRTFKSSNKQIDKMWHIYKTTKNQRIKKKQLTGIYKQVNQAESTFLKINDRKLKALIAETRENFEKVEMSILRFTDDQYRKIIYDAQVYANTGSGTVRQAVDMATKDFLSRGINSIEYANGAMVNIASYAEMAIRTANKRAYLQGEGTKRAEWGVHTVLVPNRGGGCPYCIKFQGKVFIDDVWSGGTEAESKETGYPLLSTAIKAKLFHPNCKDTTVTYFPDINTKPIPPTEGELEKKIENYKNEQKLKYVDRNIQKYKRLELGSIDKDNIEKYHNKRIEWQQYKRKLKENNNIAFKDTKKDDIIAIDKVSKEENKLKYEDVTSEMYQKAKPKDGIVKNQDYIEHEGKKYIVDNHNVKNNHDKREIEVGHLLNEIFGGDVKILPNINFPQGIKTPDYIFRGEKVDLKRIKSKRSKDCVKTAIRDSEKQAHNFIIDNTAQKVQDEAILNQIDEIYNSRKFSWVNMIYVLKEDRFLKIYKRK